MIRILIRCVAIILIVALTPVALVWTLWLGTFGAFNATELFTNVAFALAHFVWIIVISTICIGAYLETEAYVE